MSFARPRPNWDRRPSEQLPAAGSASSAVGGGKSPYRLGRQFEYSIKQQLERRGYFVLRAPSSKGKIDLLAVAKDRPVLFIQAKRLGTLGSVEWNEVYAIATEHGGWPVMCMRISKMKTGYFRLDAARDFRSREKPMSQFDPTDCSLLIAPPTLL